MIRHMVVCHVAHSKYTDKKIKVVISSTCVALYCLIRMAPSGGSLHADLFHNIHFKQGHEFFYRLAVLV